MILCLIPEAISPWQVFWLSQIRIPSHPQCRAVEIEKFKSIYGITAAGTVSDSHRIPF